MTTYVATAYRWADRNGHHYVVYAGVGFGAVVGEHDQQCEVVAAFGDAITYNWHVDTLRNIGGDVWSVAEGFGSWLTVEGVAPELTAWARGIVWRHAATEESYRRASERRGVKRG